MLQVLETKHRARATQYTKDVVLGYLNVAVSTTYEVTPCVTNGRVCA